MNAFQRTIVSGAAGAAEATREVALRIYNDIRFGLDLHMRLTRALVEINRILFLSCCVPTRFHADVRRAQQPNVDELADVRQILGRGYGSPVGLAAAVVGAWLADRDVDPEIPPPRLRYVIKRSERGHYISLVEILFPPQLGGFVDRLEWAKEAPL